MTRLNSLVDVKLVFGIFLVITIISIFLSCFITLLIFFTKTLHSSANLLICNTCLVTALYCIIETIKICLFYMESSLNDWWCRVLAYLGYTCLNLASYSYVIQGLSRLFLIVFRRHRYLLHYKSHIILIICQIMISLLISLPSVITKDIVFRSSYICWVLSTDFKNNGYILTLTYFIPLLIEIIIYGVIYYRVKKSSTTVGQSSRLIHRDLLLIRNILLLFMVFFIAGIPNVIYVIISTKMDITSKAIYMFPVVSSSFAMTIEKICLIFLNTEIQKEVKKFFIKLHLTCTSNHTTIHPLSSTLNPAVHTNVFKL